MKRNEFFSAFGISAGMLFIVPMLASCGKGALDTSGIIVPNTGGGSAVDFTLDLSQTTYSSLNNNGGSLVVNSIIVAKTVSGSFVALSAICTHQGGSLSYDAGNNRFHCPNHGANFATDGSVLNGPAQTSIKKYNVQLTGSSLRVYA